MSRVVFIADRKFNISVRFAILSLIRYGKFAGEIYLVTDNTGNDKFAKDYNVKVVPIEHIVEDQFGDNPNWKKLRFAQLKPFALDSLFAPNTIYLDADTFCINPIDKCFKIDQSFGLWKEIMKWKVMNEKYFDLWGIQKLINYNLNTGVVIFKTNEVLKGWCDVFREALINDAKLDFLLNKQLWTYDQIGLVISLSRKEVESTQLKKECNYRIPLYPWPELSHVKILHFSQYKLLSIDHANKVMTGWKQGAPSIKEIADELRNYEQD